MAVSNLRRLLPLVPLLVGGVVGQDFPLIPPDFPQCGIVCFSNIIYAAPSHGCKSDDYTCLCFKQNLYNGLHDCAKQSCKTDADSTAVLDYGFKACTVVVNSMGKNGTIGLPTTNGTASAAIPSQSPVVDKSASPSDDKKPSWSLGASIGIGVGVAVAVVVLALILFVWYRQRRKSREAVDDAEVQGSPSADAYTATAGSKEDALVHELGISEKSAELPTEANTTELDGGFRPQELDGREKPRRPETIGMAL